MRKWSSKLRWLGTLALALSSCHTGVPNLKPPRPPESYALPGESDKRYNSVENMYPKEVMGDNFLQQKLSAANGGGRSPSMGGIAPMGGGGMGGMGGMGSMGGR